MKMRQGVILVGGRASRLGDLAREVPKPLLPIAGDKRFLDFLIENFARHGVSDIVLLAGHLGDVARRRYDGAIIGGARVRVIVEPKPAGTAGALTYAADALEESFFLANGDTLFDANYLALPLALDKDTIGAMALRAVPDGARYGRVEVDGSRIAAFREKDANFVGETLVSAGLYYLRRTILDFVTSLPCSIETDVFPALVEKRALAGVESEGYFIDIGLPETLNEARLALQSEIARGAILFDRDGTLIVDEGYTYKPEALCWQSGAIEAIRRCNDAGWLAIVVSNQSGVARRLYSEADVNRFHEHMQHALAAHGAHIDAFYFCPYHGEGVIAEYAHSDHPDRKPNPGMLRRALAEWPIDQNRVVMIGDAEVDAKAAKAAGVPCRVVMPGQLLGVVEQMLFMPKRSPSKSIHSELRQRAKAARSWLFDQALPLWWKEGFDHDARCFHERLDNAGKPDEVARRTRVQARQTSVFARAGTLGWDGPWREAVEAGAQVLLNHAIRPDGGTRHLITLGGRPADERRDLYDAAFVIFGLAEAAKLIADRPQLIASADALLNWVAANWTHGDGGFSEGEIVAPLPRRQNPHMHVFEAALALYEVSGAQRHLGAASALARLFETHLFDHRHGALGEYFDQTWSKAEGEQGSLVEPGHEFEWSWLLHRWNKLGGGDLGAIAERLRIHGEVYGVDPATNAVFNEVTLDGRVCDRGSRLWPHTERLKANLARYERTRDRAAGLAACAAFDMIMHYCDTAKPGLWRDKLKPDGSFVDEPAPASSFYHLMLAMHELIVCANAD